MSRIPQPCTCGPLSLETLLSLPDFSACGTPPNITSPPYYALGGTRGGQGRPNIEVEDRFASGLLGPFVVIDNITNFFSCAVDIPCDIPIMAVKRRLGAVEIHVPSANERRRT